jgi:anti-sigma factor RsiW
MHISDDSLELYALGRLQEPELASTEEHLLLCQECRARLEETDAYVTAIREALKGQQS